MKAVRSWGIVKMLVVAAIGFAGCGGGGGGDKSPPTISHPTVDRPQLRFPGGAVTITATVTDPSGVEWVRATVTGPDRATETVTLTGDAGESYSGTYTAPTNLRSDGAAESYTVHLRARDKAGHETETPGMEAGAFQVNAAENPPEEPTL